MPTVSTLPRRAGLHAAAAATAVALLAGCTDDVPPAAPRSADRAAPQGYGVGPQYGAAHVYVAPDRVDALVDAWTATFGGEAGPPTVAEVTPTPSTAVSRLVRSPVGTLSVFGFQTPIPYPFGGERSGRLLSDFDAGVRDARAHGATTLVAPFEQPTGRDTIISFPGGIATQLYWRRQTPDLPPQAGVPTERVYLAPDSVDAFLASFVGFTRGTIAHDRTVDGKSIGLTDPLRQVTVRSRFGDTAVFVTDGHLPFPYGRETFGYDVKDVDATVRTAVGRGAVLLVKPQQFGGLRTAMLEFPGGYIVEVHTGS